MLLVTVAHELKQEHEHVDEVEVQTQRAHNNLTALRIRRITFKVHFLDRLRVISGQTCEDQNADHRDCKLQRGGAEEDVNDRSDDQAEQTHHQERAHCGQVALGRVTIERQCAERSSRYEEGANDALAGKDQEDR